MAGPRDGERAYVVENHEPESASVNAESWEELRGDFVASWEATYRDPDVPPLTADSPSFLFPGMTVGEVLDLSYGRAPAQK